MDEGVPRIGAQQRSEREELPPVREWLLAAVVAAVALAGLLILVTLVFIALRPPAWLQIALGVGLTLGTAAFAWLVASALASSRKRRSHS